MKVLMISDSYPPRIGGIAGHVSLLSRELVRKKHEVTVCTPQYGNLLTSEEVDGVKIERFTGFFGRLPFLSSNPQDMKMPPLQDLLITRKIEELVAKEKPDIIHVHGWILYSSLPLRKKSSVPFLVTLHDSKFICPKQTLMSFGRICEHPFTGKCLACAREIYDPLKAFFAYYSIKLQRAKLGQVDKAIAVSSFVKKTYLAYLNAYLGSQPGKIVTIPNFCSTREFSSLEKTPILPEDFVLFVGILAPYKGVDVLVDSYSRIDTKTKLVLIGKQAKTGLYKSRKNIVVIEEPSRALIVQAYLQCRLVVLPSIMPDACPTVALEAMAARKPVIASRIGGLTDIVVDMKTGLLVPPNDPLSLKIAIERMLSQASMAEIMGESGHQRMRSNFDAEVVVSRIESLYKSLS